MQSSSKVVLIVHNIRSSHNVGSLLRTAEGLGIHKVYLTGYTPYPKRPHDERLPHLAAKIDKDISKTALGAESLVKWSHEFDIFKLLDELKNAGYSLVALEQSKKSIPLRKFRATTPVALVIGNEVTGVEPEILDKVDAVIEIPMKGKKESFNVVQATAIAGYHLTYISQP